MIMENSSKAAISLFMAFAASICGSAYGAVLDLGPLTRDTEQGLDFLDLTLSAGRSFDDVSSEFGAGGDYEGYRYATEAEVGALIDNFGGCPPYVLGSGTICAGGVDILSALVAPLGVTGILPGSGVFGRGFTSDSGSNGQLTVTIYDMNNCCFSSEDFADVTFFASSTSNTEHGSFLVKFASADLIARYDFSGDATDSSGNGNDLAVFGATLAADRFGNANSAYKFDGTNDYMAAGFDSSTDNTFTWGFWLQDQSTTPSIRRWLSTNNSSGTPETVIIRENFAAPGGNLELHLGPGQSAEGSYIKGDWNFYTIVSDGSSMSVYIDSVLLAVNPLVSIDPESGFFVGGYNVGSLTRPEFFEGRIDDIRLYDNALTADEVRQLFAAADVTMPPPEISGLRALVGDASIFLAWDPPVGEVESYQIMVESCELEDCEFMSLGEFPVASDQLEIRIFGQFPPPLHLWSVFNENLHRIKIAAISSGVRGAWSEPVFAHPGTRPFSAPPKLKSPILFLHGFLGSGGSTFSSTAEFLQNTFKWRNGGHLFRLSEDSVRPNVDNGTIGIATCPDVDGFACPVRPDGDFFTVDFASRTAEVTGLAGQGVEIADILNFLKRPGNLPFDRFPVTLVAHSNGGLAARSFLVDANGEIATRYPEEGPQDVAALVTYGTPHRGADVRSLLSLVDSVIDDGRCDPEIRTLFGGSIAELRAGLSRTRGALDAGFRCTTGGLSFETNFMESIDRPLPSNVKYGAIVGHRDYGTILRLIERTCISFFGESIFPDGHRPSNECHSEHWDGLVPISSADINQALVTPQDVPIIDTDRFHIGQGNDFPTILAALYRTLRFGVMSPVDVEVIAPDGRRMARNWAGIPGASFMEVVDGDGHLTDAIQIPFPLPGEYQLLVTPKAEAAPNATYSIEMSVDGSTTFLARDVQVQNIPTTPYGANVVPTFDLDGDGDTDRDDVMVLIGFRRQESTICPLCDLDGDELISVLDARLLTLQCTRPRCATE